MKKVFIADDEDQAIRLLKRFVERTPGLLFVGSATNGKQVLEMLSREKLEVDLLLLDVEMPGLDGVKLAEKYKDQMDVVFVTAYEDYLKDAFRLRLADFLVKPVSYQRFLEMLELIKEHDHPTGNIEKRISGKITLSEGIKNQFQVYDLNDITYVMSASNHIHVYFANGSSIKNRRQLHEIQGLLPSDSFMKTHRSYIVNLNKIERVEHDVIKLVNGGVAELAKSKRDELLSRIGKLPD